MSESGVSYGERWNDEFFAGRLSADKLAFFEDIGDLDDSVAEWVEAALRRLHSIGLSAEDFSELMAWELGFLVPRILPSAWGGMVPPITVARRHEAIDNYLEANPFHPVTPGSRILDIGCGFPPVTAVDLAKRFPDSRITGADPQFARWIVYDTGGDYAAFREDGELRYFQAKQSDYAQFDRLLAGGQVTRDNYRQILDSLLPQLQGEQGVAEVRRGGRRLLQDPIRGFERDNLSFTLGGFGEADVGGEFDVVRCMNVLFYFDADFRAAAEDWVASILKDEGIFVCGVNWVRSEYSRYSVFQKIGGRLVHREFSIGLEAVRPLEMIPVFAFFDDDKETALQLELVRVLRADESFMEFVNRRFDQIQAELNFCARDHRGHLGGTAGATMVQMEPKMVEFMACANSPEVHHAARVVLEAAGYLVRRNEVGHTSILPGG